MVQRSFSPCFFGNKVTMAFKLIFVFAIIAVFAADALELKPCGGNKVRARGMRMQRGTLVGQYYVDRYINPNVYELTMNGRKTRGRINGCNGVKAFVQSGANCNTGGWRNFRLKTFRDTDFTLRLLRGNTVLLCYRND